MRIFLLSTLVAFGLGFAAVGGSQAATIGAGMSAAARNSSMIQDVQYRRCRQVRVCRVGPYGRRCHWERVCRW